MPVVPMRQSPIPSRPFGPTPTPTDMAIAMAVLHEQGRLFAPQIEQQNMRNVMGKDRDPKDIDAEVEVPMDNRDRGMSPEENDQLDGSLGTKRTG